MQDFKLVSSLYIHLPFCKSICSYCDFCKNFYNEKIVLSYLEALDKEISTNYKGEGLRSIYVGGGTPSCLSNYQLNLLFKTIERLNITTDYEFTFECNYEDITKDFLEIIKSGGVNRLSIGVQTFNERFSDVLKRRINKHDMINKIKLAKEYFDNVNVDLMYALPDEHISELKKDIDTFVNLDVSHISIYALIIEEHTKLHLDNAKEISDDKQAAMYELITEELKKNGYNHYEISNFAKPGYESRHNLVYWNNEWYYGFGAGASGFIENKRYDNTKSVNNYVSGTCHYQVDDLTKDQLIMDGLMLGLRKTMGINKSDFSNKYGVSITEAFDVKELLNNDLLIETDTNIFIPESRLFVSNEIIVRALSNYNLNKKKF